MRRAVYVLAQRDDETMNYTPSIVAKEDYCTDTLKPGLDKLEPGLRKSGRNTRTLFQSGFIVALVEVSLTAIGFTIGFIQTT